MIWRLALAILLTGGLISCASSGKKAERLSKEGAGAGAALVLQNPPGKAMLAPGLELVSGKARGVKEVFIDYGGRSHPAVIEEDGTFWALLNLEPDAASLRVRALSKDGSTVEETTRQVSVGGKAWISISGLDEPVYIRSGQARIRGEIREGAVSLEIQGDPAALAQGKFDHLVPLGTEGLVPLHIEAVSATGERQLLIRAVRSDRTAPRLKLVPGALVTNASETMLEVQSSEPLEWVEIAGERRKLSDEKTIQGRIALVPGQNQVEVQGADRAGNLSRARALIARDEEAPALLSCEPYGPTSADPVPVSCRASKSLSEAQVGAVTAKVSGAGFSASLLNLEEGPHDLPVILKDLAGNEMKSSAHVLVDRKAPLLEIDSPPNGRAIRESVLIAGRTERGARVFLGEEAIPTLGGLFALERHLEKGDHPLVLKARDAAGNETAQTLELDVSPDPKRFLRNTGKVPEEAPRAEVLIVRPAHKEVFAGAVPLNVSNLHGAAVSVFLNGTPLLVSAPLPPESEAFTLEDTLSDGILQEGTNVLEALVTDARGRQASQKVEFAVDRLPPKISWKNLLSGEEYGGLVPDYSVEDGTAVSSRILLDGKELRAGQGITAGREGAGPHELCIEAKDAAAHVVHKCRLVVLTPRPFAFRRGEDPRVSADAPLRRELLDPLLEDLVRAGLLGDLLLGNLDLLVDATTVFYPDFKDDLAALREVMAEQASSGEMAQLLRALLQFQRNGTWPKMEAHVAALFHSPNPGAERPLASLTKAGAEYLPQSEAEVLALDAFLGTPLGEGVEGPLGLVVPAMGALSKSPPDFWKALFAWSERLARSDLPAALAAVGRVSAAPNAGGPSDFEKSLPVLAALLGEGDGKEEGALPLLVQAYIEATTATPTAADREAFQKTIARLFAGLGDPDSLAAVGRLLDTPLVRATQEWLRRSIERGDLPLLARTLSETALRPSPRYPDELVLAASLRALSKLWGQDRRDPDHTYAGTVAAAFGGLLEKGNDGLSTAEDFLDFLSHTNELERKRMGTIFVTHSRAEGQRLDPFENDLPTDAERLMKLFVFANSPLNCGAPIPFTGEVIPLNVPGLPTLFPTDNLMTELLEASTYFDPETVLQLARLMPKVARLMTLGDALCEPEIVGDLLSDVEVLEANLDHPLLPDLLILARRMVLRGEHHAVVRMLAAFADAEVLDDAIPFLATLYQTDGAEQLYRVSVRQRAWTLESRPGVSALSHALEAGRDALAPKRGAPPALPAVVDALRGLFVDGGEVATERVLRHLAQRLVMNETKPGLGRLDLIFAKVLAADPEAVGAQGLARLLDPNAANGTLIALVKAIPTPGDEGALVWAGLPQLTKRLWEERVIPRGFDSAREFLALNAREGGALAWVITRSFGTQGGPDPSPLERTLQALAPLFPVVGRHQDTWRSWSTGQSFSGLEKLLGSLRMWTRARDSGTPHLLRLKPLLQKFAALPAPDGHGLFIDRAVAVMAQAGERGFLRTLLETAELLERRGYLDRRRPSLVEWVSNGRKASRVQP